MFKEIPTLAFLLFAAATASAQLAVDDPLDACLNLSPDTNADYATAFECVELMKSRIQAVEHDIERISVALEQGPFSTETHEHVVEGIPTGAVVAFPSNGPGARACPVGWRLFQEGIGRMIVGAGNIAESPLEEFLFTDRLAWHEGMKPGILTVGGREQVLLEDEHLPTHNHLPPSPLTFVWLNQAEVGNNHLPFVGSVQADAQGLRRNITVDAAEKLRTTGGSQPHNNMPPYIALYFCKKD